MKLKRQAAIREIIATLEIHTQEELAEALKERGFSATQATISRDIKEMHLIKLMAGAGGYRYALPEPEQSQGTNDRLVRMLSDSIVSMDSANNLIVIRTLSGSAHVAAEAIDSLNWPEILGTIAGDNTILVIARDNDQVQTFMERLNGLIQSAF